MLYFDLKYLHFLQNKLQGFVRKKDNVFNFRCPFCLDSKKNSRKMRGYIYAWKNELRFRCHNCGESHRFSTFLKKLDSYLYQQYRLELFKENCGLTQRTLSTEESFDKFDVNECDTTTDDMVQTNESIFHSICTPLNELPDDNIAVQYCLSRKIPKHCFSFLYYIDDTTKLKKFDPELGIAFPEKRLVIPFFDKNNKLIGMTCRSFDKKTNLRYLTVKLSESVQIFGMDRVDPTKLIYAVEGPIDSLFLPNAIAVTGTSFGKIDSILKSLNIAPDQIVLVLDNQPRNKELVKIQSRLIDDGYNIVIWDVSDSLGKDINALIKDANMSPANVLQILKRCTFRGLEAKMKFIQWKRC